MNSFRGRQQGNEYHVTGQPSLVLATTVTRSPTEEQARQWRDTDPRSRNMNGVIEWFRWRAV